MCKKTVAPKVDSKTGAFAGSMPQKWTAYQDVLRDSKNTGGNSPGVFFGAYNFIIPKEILPAFHEQYQAHQRGVTHFAERDMAIGPDYTPGWKVVRYTGSELEYSSPKDKLNAQRIAWARMLVREDYRAAFGQLRDLDGSNSRASPDAPYCRKYTSAVERLSVVNRCRRNVLRWWVRTKRGLAYLPQPLNRLRQ